MHNPFCNKGGGIASRRFLEVFRNVFSDTVLDVLIGDDIAIPQNYDDKYHFIKVGKRPQFYKLLSPLTSVLHRYQNLGRQLLLNSNYDYCIFDHDYLAGSLIKYAIRSNTKSIVIHHNVESSYCRDTYSKLYSSIFLPAVVQCEKASYTNAFLNVFLTKDDEKTYANLYNGCRGKSVVIWFDYEKATYNPPISHNDFTLIITGGLTRTYSVDGITHFLEDLLCNIPVNYKIIIAGRNASIQLQNQIKKYSNIELYVDCDDMQPLLNRSDVYLCPVRMGSGIKVRINDGLRTGLPVIAYSNSCRGYSDFIDKGYMFSYCNAHEFSICLRKAEELCQRGVYIRKEIIDEYNNTFSYDKALLQLRMAIKNLYENMHIDPNIP